MGWVIAALLVGFLLGVVLTAAMFGRIELERKAEADRRLRLLFGELIARRPRA